jgi:hypothetical protein
MTLRWRPHSINSKLDDYSGVFVTRAAALDALTEADFILLDVGEATQAHLKGVI